MDPLLLNWAKKLTKVNQEELTRPLLLSHHEIPRGVEINESYMHDNSTAYEKGFMKISQQGSPSVDSKYHLFTTPLLDNEQPTEPSSTDHGVPPTVSYLLYLLFTPTEWNSRVRRLANHHGRHRLSSTLPFCYSDEHTEDKKFGRTRSTSRRSAKSEEDKISGLRSGRTPGNAQSSGSRDNNIAVKFSQPTTMIHMKMKHKIKARRLLVTHESILLACVFTDRDSPEFPPLPRSEDKELKEPSKHI